MERKYLLKGLDCPHCSGLIQQEVAALETVTDTQFNLMTQCLTVIYEGKQDLLPQIEKIVHTHEPEVEVSHWRKEKPADDDLQAKTMLWRLILAGMLFIAGIALPFPVVSTAVFVAAYLVAGWDVVWQAVKNILRGQVFDENFLMSLASIGAFAIGEHHEAVAVMLFYQVGEYFQSLSVRRSRKNISRLLNIRPDHATVLRGGAVKVHPEQVAVGEVIIVLPGERIPLDGKVLEGCGELDTSALTGESMPRSVQSGDPVLSGCINLSGTLAITVTKPYGESTAAKIIDLVENASAKKAPAENFITVFARYYTPVVVLLAAALAFVPPLFVGAWLDWIRRGMVFLVVSCPCALVISVPLAYFGGIGAASRHGILVKGGNYLDALTKVDTVVFDKTGTLTQGKFSVAEISPADGFTREQLLALAAVAEQFSTHPIAKSILEAYGDEPEKAENNREVPGMGVLTTAAGKVIAAGNGQLMEQEKISYVPCDQPGTVVYVAVDGVFAGAIRIADTLKSDSAAAIQKLKALGVRKTVMLTGDDSRVARSVAEALSIDDHYGQLLPQEKLEMLEKIPGKTAFVGDGINDAPCLARADIGIAMGGLGSDAAIEAADIVLMTDEPTKLCKAIGLARNTRSIVIQNILFALGVKAIILILGALGIAGMWAAVFADVGVAVLAVLNAMRVLKK
ncbi:MAG: cadmium-translocating P-type ATPase [Oscillospiraceae bacterium]|nr:cadmium-translocating P-type ATPase [Oscillospiraceae bacterium]